MKTILAAMIIACMAAPAAVAPAAAASLTITTDNGWNGDRIEWRHRHHHRHHWRGDRGRHYGWRKHHRRDCYVKVKRHWRHHHLVIRKVRICD